MQSVPGEVHQLRSARSYRIAPPLGGLREVGWGILAPCRRDQRKPSPHNLCAGRAELTNVRPPTVSDKECPPDQTHARGTCKNLSKRKLASSAQAANTQSHHCTSEYVNDSTPTCDTELFAEILEI